MKQDIVTNSKLAGAAIAGSGTATGLNHWNLDDWATVASISVSCATFIFVVAQLAFLIWKWRQAKKGKS